MSGAGTVIAGKYRLERMIGRGGMGSVWRARNLRLDMPVAIKFMEAGAATAPDARTRFEREAKAAAQIRSPHVVQVLDHGVDEDAPFIVMELLEGEDLGQRLRRVGRMSPAELEPLLTQVARGLRRAHESGVIHRDLKPGNIFLARGGDGEEVVKLLDFGVAKLRWGALGDVTQTGTLLGSPSYMSPEQARGHRTVDHRSDLWSLGVIIFRVTTGVKPFVADSIAELIIKLCIEPPPVASRILPGLPVALDAFFTRAFEQDPERRFQSALEMAAEFAAIARTGVGAPASANAALPPAAPPRAPDAGEPTVTPSSQSAPLPAQAFLQARAVLEQAVSRTAPLEPDAPRPRTTVLLEGGPVPSPAPPGSGPRSATPQPPGSGPRSGPHSAPVASAPAPGSGPAISAPPGSGPATSAPPGSGPRSGPHSAPRIPLPELTVASAGAPPSAPAQPADDEMALYLAGGVGGPVAGVMLPAPEIAGAPGAGAQAPPFAGGGHEAGGPRGSQAPDSSGGDSTLSTTSHTLPVPLPQRRLLVLGAVAAAVTMTLVLVVALIAGGSGEDEGAQASSSGAAPAEGRPADQPPGPAPDKGSAPAGQPGEARPGAPDQPAAAPPPGAGSQEAPPGQPAQPPGEGASGEGAGQAPSGSGAAPGGTQGKPTWKRPAGSTKKPKGVDLGY